MNKAQTRSMKRKLSKEFVHGRAGMELKVPVLYGNHGAISFPGRINAGAGLFLAS